ncbi:c-type cytochrome [Oceanomicrobium pacificus]|uniref:C-type cytochrome n=1 Tax=Oceanomicrobium pacificus TaxID=2692916 RepID=A0A6B0TXG0_9RHOB|nr:cytochrome c [Oceanomicrobium pacificus]MXU65982.1 c-type cytochrome [Oceanomicrobium pacificus]
MLRFLGILALLGLAGLALFWVLTRPERIDPDVLAGLAGDAARGERIFHLGGCASCHAAPEAEGEARLVLAGGRRLASPFGTFVAPNISSDPEHGIGGWTAEDLVNAMQFGTSPEGTHFYPAFPYTSYRRMDLGDIVDLHAYLGTLPPDATPSVGHDLPFPFTIRRGLGLWKRLHLKDGPVLPPESLSAEAQAGQVLVEGGGHCGECHTPRGLTGGLALGNWLAGAANPSGEGRIPDITPGPDGIGDWSVADIAGYLTTGFTPEFDSVGGEMVEVVKNMAALPEADVQAIAAYLAEVPASGGASAD